MLRALRPHDGVRDTSRLRLQRAILLLVTVSVSGTIGYRLLGLSWLDAAYQALISVTTVGYREVGEVTTTYKIFTMVFILVGVGAALYTLSVLFETLVEGRLDELFGRRRMAREIASMRGHVVLCGSGRVGRVLASLVTERGAQLVLIEQDAERAALAPAGASVVVGDARDDDVLRQAGIERASTLVAALTTDADNVYVTLAARALNPSLFIVSRAHLEDAEEKLRRAGADRVVNPQHIGGQRMAAFALQPNVAEFLDVVMHEGGLEWRIEELPIEPSSPIVGESLESADIRRLTGALVLAIREPGGPLRTNPDRSARLAAGTVLVAMGMVDELDRLERLVDGRPIDG